MGRTGRKGVVQGRSVAHIRVTWPVRSCCRRREGSAFIDGAAMKPVGLTHNARVLVVILRRLGDVLLTTPLIRSIKRAYPQASIDALVFTGTEGVLAGNPDIAAIIDMPQRPGLADTLSLMARLFRRYDLAVSVQTGDRPTALAVIAGRRSVGPVEAEGLASALKRFFLTRSYVRDPS